MSMVDNSGIRSGVRGYLQKLEGTKWRKWREEEVGNPAKLWLRNDWKGANPKPPCEVGIERTTGR